MFIKIMCLASKETLENLGHKLNDLSHHSLCLMVYLPLGTVLIGGLHKVDICGISYN